MWVFCIMELAPHYFNPGTCKLQGLRRASSPRFSLLRTNINSCSYSSSAQILHKVEGFGEVCSNYGNERAATSSHRHQSLREQLRLLNLDSLSKRVLLGSSPAPRKLEDENDERRASNRHLKKFKERTRESQRPMVSTSVGQLLRL